MRDVIFLVVVGLFFTLAAAYVRACAALISADEPTTAPTSERP